MAYQIIWSPRAAHELSEIVRFISGENRAAAERLADRIIQHVEHLADHPLIGQVYLRTAKREVRHVVKPPYRIFYRVDDRDARVVILTVWHGARREPKL